MVESLEIIPTVAHGNHCRNLAIESIGCLDAGMGKGYSVTEYESAAEVVVITVVPADYFISHVGSELPHIETQTLPDGSDVADEQLGNIHVVCAIPVWVLRKRP